MASNSTLDDVLSMISDENEETPKKASTQQTLRDRMLSESNSARQNTQMKEKEEELSEEIITEEEEEEYDTKGRNKKFVFIVIALILAVITAIILVITLTKGKGEETEEVVEEQTEVTEELVTEEPVEQESIFKTTYDFDQIQNLLAAGATQEQVQTWQNNGVEYDYVYLTMLDRYYGWQLNNTLPTYDMTSPEYKEIIGKTWMSLPLRTDIAEWTEDKYLAYSYEVEQNLDYEKIEPYGNQLFLKVYLDADTHDSWFFLNVTPQDWNMLDDTGNVVVDYTYQTHWLPYENQLDAVEDKENIFITSATLNIIESQKNIERKNGEQGAGSILDQVGE